jgi:hypothetical protein
MAMLLEFFSTADVLARRPKPMTVTWSSLRGGGVVVLLHQSSKHTGSATEARFTFLPSSVQMCKRKFLLHFKL